MPLKILVTGSSNRRYDSTRRAEASPKDCFVEFCRSVGMAMAKSRHQLIILSDNPAHADSHVLEGYLSAVSDPEKLPPVLVSYGTHDDPENPHASKFSEMRARYAAALFQDFNAEGEYPFNPSSYTQAWLPQL
ncbi:hypothetical protein [Burkholderia ubonensis]|uniref:hypothetical protein n=1 Tax=Burkholderia ubonensis TaxID=101571 RepID=UPI000A61235F|nr:hypothetical protein [Burkholderia ubonensis]